MVPLNLNPQLLVYLLIAVILVCLPVHDAFGWYDGEPADLVLGQPNFTSNKLDITQTGMASAADVAFDPTTGKIFVSDPGSFRVLRFANLASISNDSPAEVVLGQSDFTSNGYSATQTGMAGPMGMAVESSGTLWVADSVHDRVLRFDKAASKANGANADGVLGQTDFTSHNPATTQTGMFEPTGVAVDSNGTLWVVDQRDNRVLRFDKAASNANGANADSVLGQPDFTSSAPVTTQTGMKMPNGVAVDSNGTLWVVDTGNNRVLRFDKASSKANGASADGVLGQLDFTNHAPVTTQTGMRGPFGVAVDSIGTLWVADGGNHRVLRFDKASSKANGANADGVLGQPNIISSVRATTQTGMSLPMSVAVDSSGTL